MRWKSWIGRRTNVKQKAPLRPTIAPMAILACDGRGVHDGKPWYATAESPATPEGRCPHCGGNGPEYLFGIRIDDAENIGRERTDPRTAGVNLGLPGRSVVVGRKADGSAKMGYEPARSAEYNNNRKIRDHALANGLTPIDGGRYRSR